VIHPHQAAYVPALIVAQIDIRKLLGGIRALRDPRAAEHRAQRRVEAHQELVEVGVVAGCHAGLPEV